MVPTNLPFNELTEGFGSERLTGALLYRLTHHVHILEMNGESYRLKCSRENAQHKPRTNQTTHKSCQKPSSLTHSLTCPACCQPASVTLVLNNWRGHLRWPMTSLVVHFCSAPLVDAQRLCQGNGPAIMSVVAVSSQ